MNAEYGWSGKIMSWLRVVAALIVVNLLFVAGALIGLLVLGLMPAAYAATATLTALRDGETQGLVRIFVRTYRRSFLRANLVGLPFGVVGLLIAADTAILVLLPPMAAAAVTGFTWLIAAIAVAALAALLAIDARYEDAPAATLRYAAVLPFISPVMFFALLVALAAMGAALALLPVLIPLVGFSVPIFVATWFADHRLSQLDPEHPRTATATAAVVLH